MTNRERAERFFDGIRIDENLFADTPNVRNGLSAEFDAVAREAAAQERREILDANYPTVPCTCEHSSPYTCAGCGFEEGRKMVLRQIRLREMGLMVPAASVRPLDEGTA